MTNGGSVYAKASAGMTNVRAIVRYDQTGGNGYVTEIECRHNGRKVLGMRMTEKATREPYVEFRFKGGVKGDVVEMSWRDSTGTEGSTTGRVL